MVINGQEHNLPATTLDKLLEQLGYQQRLVAVELDGAIIRRQDYASAQVEPSSTVEIVSFVGGG